VGPVKKYGSLHISWLAVLDWFVSVLAYIQTGSLFVSELAPGYCFVEAEASGWSGGSGPEAKEKSPHVSDDVRALAN